MRAQIELAIKKIPRVSHISAHMGCYYMTPEVNALAKRLAVEYKIDIEPEALGVQRVDYAGPKRTLEEKKKKVLLPCWRAWSPARRIQLLDHPGLDSPELRAIHHIGYENVAEDRQGVTDTWTSAEIKAIIRKKEFNSFHTKTSNLKILCYGS